MADAVTTANGKKDADKESRCVWQGGVRPDNQATNMQWFLGMLYHLIFAGVWIGGVFTPLTVVVLLCIGGQIAYTLVAIIAAIIVYPYIVKPGAWPAFKHAIPEWGQYYHKTCAYYMEDPEETWAAAGAGEPLLLCYHPHGVLSWSFVLNGGFREKFEPGVGIVADALFHTPLFRWVVAEWTGATECSSKDNVRRLMQKKTRIGLLPGGFEEASISQYGVDRVYVNSRKGFIKYALEYGYWIVPVYCFGEVDTYYNVPGFWKLRLWLNKCKFPGVLAAGAWWCPLLPKRSNINTVFGKALRPPQIDKPTAEDVDKWHATYVQELKALYDRHKHRFASHPGEELEVW